MTEHQRLGWAEARAAHALSLFRAGKDTADIAFEMKIPEAVASLYVWAARCREKGLPVRSEPAPRFRRVVA